MKPVCVYFYIFFLVAIISYLYQWDYKNISENKSNFAKLFVLSSFAGPRSRLSFMKLFVLHSFMELFVRLSFTVLFIRLSFTELFISSSIAELCMVFSFVELYILVRWCRARYFFAELLILRSYVLGLAMQNCMYPCLSMLI